MVAIDLALQVGILILTLAILISIQFFSKQPLTKLRNKNRTAVQSNRHLLQGTHFLARAKSSPQNPKSQTLAENALLEAETAISFSPKDPAPLILKALALDLLGHKGSALKSLDSALSWPRVKGLSRRERADALVKRAELKIAVNRRRRIDSAIEDLREAVTGSVSSAIDERGFCLLGQCYEWIGMKEQAQWAFKEALRVQPGSVLARQGLDRLGL